MALIELIQEEVLELNKLEDRVVRGNPGAANMASKSMLGKFHDYKNVDLREISTIFEEYKQAESRLKRYMDE